MTTENIQQQKYTNVSNEYKRIALIKMHESILPLIREGYSRGARYYASIRAERLEKHLQFIS